MHIGRIDASATKGDSWLHRVSPRSKLIAFAFVLAAVVLTWNAIIALSIAVALLAVAASARLSWRLMLALTAYPTLFALIFAFSAATSLMGGLVIVLKAVTAALAAITLILTTPYPYVFAPIQRVVPAIVGDSLLMTYRSLFLLLGKFASLMTAARLRANLTAAHPVRTARASTRALGGLLVYAFDLSQRSYDIMKVRGYEGRLRVTLPLSAAPLHDTILIASAVALLTASLLWRLEWQTLNPYSWIVLLPSLSGLAIALVAPRKGLSDARR